MDEPLTFSRHCRERMSERGITEEWVRQTIAEPMATAEPGDERGNAHYWRTIEGFGGRVLKVVVNPTVSPRRVVTVHWDRRITRFLEREDEG